MRVEKVTHVLTRDEHNLVMASLALMVAHDEGVIEHMRELAKKDKRLKKSAPRAVRHFRKRQKATSQLQVKMIKALFGDK